MRSRCRLAIASLLTAWTASIGSASFAEQKIAEPPTPYSRISGKQMQFVDPELQKQFELSINWSALRKQGDEATELGDYGEAVKLYVQAKCASELCSRNAKNEDEDEDEDSKSKVAKPKFLDDDYDFRLKLAKTYSIVARYFDAREELEKILKSNEISSKIRAQALAELAEIALLSGDLEGAEKFLGEAVTADGSNLKVKILQAQQKQVAYKFDESEKLYSEVLQTSRMQKEARIEGAARDGLAYLFELKNDRVKAREHAKTASDAQAQTFGPNSLEATMSKLTLASASSDIDPQKSQETYLNSIPVIAKRVGTLSHPDIARVYHLLATNKLTPAPLKVQYCLLAQRTIDGVLPETSPLALATLNLLADAYESQEKLKPALEVCERAATLQSALYGAKSVPVARCLDSKARIQIKIEFGKASTKRELQFDTAEATTLEAIKIVDEAMGPTNKYSTELRTLLAWIKVSQKKYGEAISMGEDLRSQLVKNLGPDSSSVRFIDSLLARAYAEGGEKRKAAMIVVKLLKESMQQNGLFNLETLKLLRSPDEEMPLMTVPGEEVTLAIDGRQFLPDSESELGSTMLMLQSYDIPPGGSTKSPETRLKRTISYLQLDELKYGSDSPALYSDLLALATEYERQDQKDKALSTYQKAIQLIDSGWGDDPRLVKVLSNYSALLKKTGNETEAATQEARADALSSKFNLNSPDTKPPDQSLKDTLEKTKKIIEKTRQ